MGVVEAFKALQQKRKAPGGKAQPTTRKAARREQRKEDRLQKKQRKRDLRNWMRFCPQPGTCPRGRKACARCEASYWTSDKVLHVWVKCAAASSSLHASVCVWLTHALARRREARATRLKHSPTSIKLRFAKYLADDLCHQGIVPGRAAVVDCSCCSGCGRAASPMAVLRRGRRCGPRPSSQAAAGAMQLRLVRSSLWAYSRSYGRRGRARAVDFE